MKPKEDGWYQCTILYVLSENNGNPEYGTYVMDLHWYSGVQKWKDNRRQNVFTDYDVYLTYEFDQDHYVVAPQNRTKQHIDNLCDRTDSVIAWRPMPKPFMKEGINYYLGNNVW